MMSKKILTPGRWKIVFVLRRNPEKLLLRAHQCGRRKEQANSLRQRSKSFQIREYSSAVLRLARSAKKMGTHVCGSKVKHHHLRKDVKIVRCSSDNDRSTRSESRQTYLSQQMNLLENRKNQLEVIDDMSSILLNHLFRNLCIPTELEENTIYSSTFRWTCEILRIPKTKLGGAFQFLDNCRSQNAQR